MITMNQKFNLSRFGQLLKHYWAENSKRYLTSFGLIVGLMLFLMLPIVGTSQYSELFYLLHVFAFLGGVMLGGSLFTSTAFSAYSTPERGISAIMLPASRTEKFIVILLIHALFAVLVFAIGHLLHSVLSDLANQGLPEGSREYRPIPDEVARFFGFSYFILQGTLFLGSLYFTKNAFVKTVGVVLIITIIAFIINLQLAFQFVGEADSVITFPFIHWMIYHDQNYQISFPPVVSTWIRVFLGLIVVAFGYITFVRLQEKEI